MQYQNKMVSGPGRPKYNSSTEGRMIGTALGLTTRAGKEYRVVRWEYKDIPFVSAPSDSLFRQDERGVISANEIEGKLLELLELPANSTVGTTWDYNDGADSTRSITSVGEAETPAGKFSDCITVTRKFKKPETEKQFKSQSIYCAGVGEVSWNFKQDLNGSISDTEKKLLGISGKTP